MHRHRHLLWALLTIFIVLPPLTYVPVQAHGDQPAATPAPGTGADEQGGVQASLGVPSLVEAQAGSSTAGHVEDDYYLAEQARLRNEPAYVAPKLLYSAAAAADLSKTGQWGPVVTWPFAFAAAANLPDGRIIAWGGDNPRFFSGGTSTYASVWDPATGQFLARDSSIHSMFCGIPVMLEDGRVFVNGGDGTPERNSTFDYRTNTWTRVQDMQTGRWYPGTVALPNGQVFTALGRPGGRYPEVWTAGTGWTYLTGADLQGPILDFPGYQNNWLPYFFLSGDGRIFHSGPTQQMNWITPTGNGSIAAANLSNSWYPKYATGVMYDEGKILVAGGQANPTEMAATNKAMSIDLTRASAGQDRAGADGLCPQV